jgi:hypothetical protein
MDTRVKEALDKWEAQIDEYISAIHNFKLAKIQFEHEEAKLILAQDSTKISAQTLMAMAKDSWKKSRENLLQLEVLADHAEKLLTKRIKDYEAEYGSFRKEEEILRKGRL